MEPSGGDLVLGAQAVLHHHQGLAVAVVQVVQSVAQPLGIDLPAPVAGLQIGVGHPAQDVALAALASPAVWQEDIRSASISPCPYTG